MVVVNYAADSVMCLCIYVMFTDNTRSATGLIGATGGSQKSDPNTKPSKARPSFTHMPN